MPVIQKIADALHLGSKTQSDQKANAPPTDTAQKSTGPALDHNKVTVVFVLGGPGAGTLLGKHLLLELHLTVAQVRELKVLNLLKTTSSSIFQVPFTFIFYLYDLTCRSSG